MSRTVPRLTLKVYSQASYRRRFTYIVDDEPYPLANHRVRMQIRINPLQDPAIITLSSEDASQIVLDSVNGHIDVHIDEELTALLVQKSYFYDIMLDTPDEEVLPLVWGNIKVKHGATWVDMIEWPIAG